MKKYILFAVLVFFISCTTNHFHDGRYKASVFTNSSLTWANIEIVEILGSEVHVTVLSPDEKNIIEEYKTTCVQYPDRIEYKGRDGVQYVVRSDSEGNLKFGEYSFKKLNGNNPDTIQESIAKSEPVKENPPFFGTKYFNFYGGNGTGYSITIEKAERINLKSDNPLTPFVEMVIKFIPSHASGNEPSVMYDGEYKALIEAGGAKFKIVGNTIENLNKDGTVMTGCMEDGKPCIVNFESE